MSTCPDIWVPEWLRPRRRGVYRDALARLRGWMNAPMRMPVMGNCCGDKCSKCGDSQPAMTVANSSGPADGLNTSCGMDGIYTYDQVVVNSVTCRWFWFLAVPPPYAPAVPGATTGGCVVSVAWKKSAPPDPWTIGMTKGVGNYLGAGNFSAVSGGANKDLVGDIIPCISGHLSATLNIGGWASFSSGCGAYTYQFVFGP